MLLRTLALLMVTCLPACPAIIGISNPVALAANDSVSWLQLGSAVSTLPGTVTAVSTNGMGLTAASSAFARVDEGYGWTSDFNLNDQLLWNTDSGTPVRFVFANAIRGAGAYIQGDLIGNFSATVTAYFGSTALGSFAISGANHANQDGSAAFLGILSDSPNITSIVFSEQSASGPVNEFALDTLEIVTAVPEPGSFYLVAIAFGTVGLLVRKRG